MELGGTSSPDSRPDAAAYRADWYPDPTRRFDFRYHNGRDWTGDVSVDGNRFLDPLTSTAVGGAVPARTPFPIRPPSALPPARSGKATAALVLGIASVVTGWAPFVFVIGAASAILALVFGISILRRKREERPPNSGFAVAAVILAPIGLALCGVGVWLSVITFRAVEQFANVGAYSIEETSCVVNDGVAIFDGTITNLSDDTRSYHVSVSFVRPGTDNALYVSTADVDDVAAGTTMPWSVLVVVREDDLDCVIEDVKGPLPFGQS